jgi:hypothetical protein
MAKDKPVPEDRWEPQSNGTIKAVIGGERFRLRRPTIGEQREFVERLEEIADEQTQFNEKVRAAADAAAAGDPDPNGLTAATLRSERRAAERHAEEALLGWWRRVISTLETDGATLPEDDDDLPSWLLGPQLTAETRRVWLQIPWGPGGSPSQQEAAKATRQLQGALSALQTRS